MYRHTYIVIGLWIDMFIVIGIVALTLLASNYERCGNTNYV